MHLTMLLAAVTLLHSVQVLNVQGFFLNPQPSQSWNASNGVLETKAISLTNGSICRGDNCVEKHLRAVACENGYGEFRGTCRKCDCGKDEAGCMFSDEHWVLKKDCLCKSGYGDKRGKCVGCSCGGLQHNCTFTGLFSTRTTCHCAHGYREINRKCEKIDPCEQSPCLNGGICVAVEDTYACICNEFHKGKNCEKERDPCNPNPCLNSGRCSKKEKEYVCECEGQYDGKNCEKEIDPCELNPCLNDGKCIANGNEYVCECDDLYEGERCEKERDPCNPNPCLNTGRCTRKGREYNCECEGSYNGKNCEKGNPCIPNPCMQDADCNPTVDFRDFICYCPEGYLGKLCSKSIVDILSYLFGVQKEILSLANPCRKNELCNTKELRFSRKRLLSVFDS